MDALSGTVIPSVRAESMIKFLSIPAAFVGIMLTCIAGYTQTGKAPCGSFQRLADGKMERREAN